MQRWATESSAISPELNLVPKSESIGELLRSGTSTLLNSSDSARLDTELLLCHSLNQPREFLYSYPEQLLTKQQNLLYQSLLERRVRGEPLAYLTGVREFWSLSFNVTTDTLIPRPETELIVEHSLIKLDQTGSVLTGTGSPSGPFLDLGTGCGAIAISVASERPDTDVYAIDNSCAALSVAKGNANKLDVIVNFRQSHWFDQLEPINFAVIAANPPYIADDDPHLERGGLVYEPLDALRSCENGFADITAIISQSSDFLMSGGWLLLEHGHTQGEGTRELMSQHHFSQVETLKDIVGNPRVTLGCKA